MRRVRWMWRLKWRSCSGDGVLGVAGWCEAEQMEEVLGELLRLHGALALICLTVISCVGLRCWMRVSLMEQIVRMAESSMERESLVVALNGVLAGRSMLAGLQAQYGRWSWGMRVLVLMMICFASIVFLMLLSLFPLVMISNQVHYPGMHPVRMGVPYSQIGPYSQVGPYSQHGIGGPAFPHGPVDEQRRIGWQNVGECED